MNTDNSNKNKPLPSVPDAQSEPGKHDEPRLERKKDVMPKGNFDPSGKDRPHRNLSPKAALRLQIEALLQRREAAPPEVWKALGDEAVSLLVELVDETTLPDAIRQRVVATLGQLNAPQAVDRLGRLLTDRTEKAIDRTYAAHALGQIGGGQAVPWLGRAIVDKDPMVRLQVTRAFTRIKSPDTLPYLLTLSRDANAEVARVADGELQQSYREQLPEQYLRAPEAPEKGTDETRSPAPEKKR
mgnify:CR=1 FL=1